MSRTYRKQSGDRHWRNAHRSTYNFHSTNIRIPYIYTDRDGKQWKYYQVRSNEAWAKTWDEIEKEIQENIIRNEKKDGHWWDSVSRNVKWHSNKMVRQGNRRELHRVMKDPENYDYNRDHDLRKRGLWWCYD
ncbi:hypothetical protein [Salmonella phage GSP001]|uniref:Uncharacterized protein n=1 Tax=Salmonella phage GSP001 TaxID=2962598 RepID=A0A9E7PIC3_9CAUD|nr:hypothetical protein [Salmonella phage GSP001]